MCVKLDIKMLWAKSEPRKSLVGHMLDVGVVARELLKCSAFSPIASELANWMDADKKSVISFVAYVAAVHDIGKSYPCFQENGGSAELQERLREIAEFSNLSSSGFRHERYSKTVLKRVCREKGRFSTRTTAWIGEIVSLHHQGKNGYGYKLPENWTGTPAWHAIQDELEALMWETFLPAKLEIREPNIDAVCMLLLGITIISDWIASSAFFSNLDIDGESPANYPAQAEQRAMQFIEKSGYMLARLPKCSSFTELWPDIPHKGMRPLQKTVDGFFAANCTKKPLAVILEAPMGEGKTEAGLYAALRLAEQWDKDGFYVGLPTAATSNQMYDRVKRMLCSHGEVQARLLHATAWLVDENSEEAGIQTEDEAIARAWTMPMRRGLLSPFAVGTVDQVMMAVLAVKYGVLRLTGLASKVLVLDEVHAYDAYMSSIIVRLLQWCRALCIPVVMLSATLPRQKKKEYMDVYYPGVKAESAYPSMTVLYDGSPGEIVRIPNTFQKYSVELRTLAILGEEVAVAEQALWEVCDGGCLCVLVNTVREAQKIYKVLKERANKDCELLLFHARFSEGRKHEIEQSCEKFFGKNKKCRPVRAILVATQVVEQSLDLDFDRMITALAPIDLLLQRLGRLHRHRETERPISFSVPRLEVMIPPPEASDDPKRRYGRTGYVYAGILLLRTEQLLEGMGTIRIPEDIATAVERVYSGDVIGEELQTWTRYHFDCELATGQAVQYELAGPEPDEFSLAYTDAVFDDSESPSFLDAKTRLGADSVRLALVPQDLYTRVKASEYISRELAKDVLECSVTIPSSEGKKVLTKADGCVTPLIGRGLLTGITIFAAVEGCCPLPNGKCMRMDPEYGFEIMEE